MMNLYLTFKRRRFIQFSALSMAGLLSGLYGCRRSAGADAGGGAFSAAGSGKLGVALVGLGKYSEEQLAPALLETRACRLAGIVTGSPEKIGKWQRKYDIPDRNVYSYSDFDRIAENPDIDIVYVVLPNALHKEYTVRAAKAGKHVICEKPMAVSAAECEEMVGACKKAGKLLSIGYRMHFDPSTLLIRQLGENKTLGNFTTLTARDSQKMKSGQWRLDRALAGGGPLMDLGIYCVQASLYCGGELPVAVKARFGKIDDPEKFASVEQSIAFDLTFPSGLVAHCHSSYAEEENSLRAESDREWLEFSPAFSYSGLKGKTSQGKMNLPEVNQQALQMDDFARCVNEGTPSRVPGEMGLRDLKILEAIYEAAETGSEVKLKL